MKTIAYYGVLFFILGLLVGCSTSQKRQQVTIRNVNTRVDAREVIAVAERDVIAVAEEVAAMFNYYDVISPKANNIIVGLSEIGGQCGDYALAFVNKWNKRHPEEAVLVIQQQGSVYFPDGLYKVIGKDRQNLPFLKNRQTSMLYIWNGVKGIGHPQLGGYEVKLIEKLHVTRHFGAFVNAPHVWVRIGNLSIDPTYTDTGNQTIGYDLFHR